jgi:rhodanese-related sulfurtransferase
MIDEVSAQAAWLAVQTDPEAVLCDVRTDTEWTHVGIPDVSQAGKQVTFVSWKFAPDMRPNPHFIDELRAAGLTPDHHIYFICRSGARSHDAATTAQSAGFHHVYNVTEGFEGRPGQPGWLPQGLPARR